MRFVKDSLEEDSATNIFDYLIPRVNRPTKGKERTCNSHRAFTEGEMLPVTKNRASVWDGLAVLLLIFTVVGV